MALKWLGCRSTPLPHLVFVDLYKLVPPLSIWLRLDYVIKQLSVANVR